MIQLKVKTLDGRTHEFSVPDDATILQFKDIIREKMDIAVDRQRLLYQGRVLQDDMPLSSYDLEGNVMHLVTRMPPQARGVHAEGSTATEREENSDINRDQIRNILSDVFNNIGDINQSPLGVSVNNEGSRMDITVNIPTQNRLSLSRLRQNYVQRLLHQARQVLNHLEFPQVAHVPRSDRERLRQADPYDIGPNEERLSEVTSQPLPISNLADMLGLARSLWRSAEPQLELWESVLRREPSAENGTQRTESEMQRIHDSASRYVHLFSHILHILSDYLVEFQQPEGPTVMRATATAATTSSQNISRDHDVATSVSVDDQPPLTGAFGESGMAHSETTATSTAEMSDRSRYLYVFSEMPAQLVQVRLDVDSNIRDMRTPQSTQPPPTTGVNQPTITTSTESTRPTETPVESHGTSTAPQAATDTQDNIRARARRRFQTNGAGGTSVENLFRSTLHDTLMGSNIRPQMSSGSASRSIRSSPQFMENVDPYVRCQSRHFQHPSNLRTGAVISTFSGIRLREGSRPRPRASNNATTNEGTPTSTANNTTNPTTNVNSTSTDNDPVRSLISGLMNSIFSSPMEDNSTPVAVPATVEQHADRVPSEQNRPSFTFSRAGGSNLNAPLSEVFPEMLLAGQDLQADNFLTNDILQLVVSSLTLADFMALMRGQYSALNQLRVPLQELLTSHQRQAGGSRDLLVDHIVSDLEIFNRYYISVFDRLRSGVPVDNLSEEARNSLNIRLDICRTLNNLNRHHFQSMIDMIMRSPTNQGFGQLLMSSLTSHHDESLALIDIMCNNNDELRQYLIKAFLDSLASSMNTSAVVGSTPSQVTSESRSPTGLDMLFGDIFRRPEQLTELKEHTLNNFVVYLADNGTSEAAAVATGVHINSADESINGNVDSIEDMVINLSSGITNGVPISGADQQQTLSQCSNGVTSEFMDSCDGVETGGAAAPWQTVLPQEWLQIVSHDSRHDSEAAAVLPYSDAYVAGMPPKRRKVILSQRQRAVQPASEMMEECLDQALRTVVGLGVTAADARVPLSADLNEAFQEMVSERVGTRLAAEAAVNFPSDRFPSAEHHFNRKKRSEPEDKN